MRMLSSWSLKSFRVRNAVLIYLNNSIRPLKQQYNLVLSYLLHIPLKISFQEKRNLKFNSINVLVSIFIWMALFCAFHSLVWNLSFKALNMVKGRKTSYIWILRNGPQFTNYKWVSNFKGWEICVLLQSIQRIMLVK